MSEEKGFSEEEKDNLLAEVKRLQDAQKKFLEENYPNMPHSPEEAEAMLRAALPKIKRLARGKFGGSDRERQIVRVLAIKAEDVEAMLNALLPNIERLHNGNFDGSERERQIVRLLACITLADLSYRDSGAERT
jgi:hypothetical protein